MKIILWTIHTLGIISILLGVVCTIKQQYGLAYIVGSNGICNFLVSVFLYSQYKHIDLKIVNKHLAESVFGPTADSVKQDIRHEVSKIKSEIVIDAAIAKKEIKQEADKAKTLIERKVGQENVGE